MRCFTHSYRPPWKQGRLVLNSEVEFGTVETRLIASLQCFALPKAILCDFGEDQPEQRAKLKEREFIKHLWSLQEFSLEKIALLTGTSLERVIEVVSAHLHAGRRTKRSYCCAYA